MTTEMMIAAVVITAANVTSLVLGVFVGKALWMKEDRRW